MSTPYQNTTLVLQSKAVPNEKQVTCKFQDVVVRRYNEFAKSKSHRHSHESGQ